MTKILLVEDNEMNRDMLERRLVRRGYEVVLAVDGVESIEKARTEKPDLILMDMGLPVMDGYEATRLLKENRETRSIPILGLSAHAMSGAAERALEAGCDDYDTKPVEVKRLMTKVQALLEQAAEGQEPSHNVAEESAAPTPDPEVERRPHILLVEANPEHIDVLSRRVAAVGCTYEVAEDGEEALQRLNDKRFVTVILATSLPRYDGLQVLEWMRRNEGLKDLPVLVLGSDEDEAVQRCLRAGAQDCLAPPFRKEVVEWRLQACVGSRTKDQGQQQQRDQLAREQRRSERLMKAIMPEVIIHELRTTRAVRPRRVERVAVLSCRVVNLHRFCQAHELEQAFGVVQKLIETFEELAERHGLEEIRIGGDTYIVAAGLLDAVENPVHPCVSCALEIKESFASLGPGFSVQAGIHVGMVMAGLAGRRKFHFNIWGEAVHLATVMEGYGVAAPIKVSAPAWRQIEDTCVGQSLGSFSRSETGEMEVYRVDGWRSIPRPPDPSPRTT